ncbi:MFS transporter [Massilia sp. P8910]|uniref:MFS transporter n=1 Tax=Massilia antarctica TaxID=2765360 RepID=UPI0006BB72A5|nr:MFS transporter [Massilia antarctica]MCE3607007.1 MFS transporter [Massilia antarctica]CUI03996.1 Arabinose efflux permease [Janthinobacterium sp. CG23_2]CUU27782.1 Arabinose efflux permease [Janthinobacterium sp. CG23_2]
MSKPSRAILLVAALQFVYLVDFMMVLPLGPDLAREHGFAFDRLGWLAAAYTLASAVSGLVTFRLLDRFDRKPALLLTFALLALATLATTFCHGLPALMLARALTGAFGGPAVAIGMAIVIDLTPPEQRGKAMAKVMLGFSLAAIAGVPLGLELARIGGWQAPFYMVAALAALVLVAMACLLPALEGHLSARQKVSARILLARPAVRLAMLLQAGSAFSAFLVIPHFSAYFLLNLGFPRAQLGMLYFAGGVVALLTVQLLGRLADRSGPVLAAGVATTAFCAGLAPFFGLGAALPILFFVLFMAGNAGRNVTMAATVSQVPSPHERAGFMSLQSLVQDVAIGAAALVTSWQLGEAADGRLTGMAPLAALAAVIAVSVAGGLARLAGARRAVALE